MNFEFDETKATEESVQGGGYLTTGVHKGKIIAAVLAKAGTGTTGIDWHIQIEGQRFVTTIYGMWCARADGSEIFNAKTVQRLMGLNKIKKLTVVKQEVETHNGKEKLDVYKELSGLEVNVSLQKVLDVYNGTVKDKKFEVKEFFNSKNQTYAEQVKNSEAKQYIFHSEKMKDGQTSEYKKYIADGGGDEVEADSTDTEESGDGIL